MPFPKLGGGSHNFVNLHHLRGYLYKSSSPIPRRGHAIERSTPCPLRLHARPAIMRVTAGTVSSTTPARAIFVEESIRYRCPSSIITGATALSQSPGGQGAQLQGLLATANWILPMFRRLA